MKALYLYLFGHSQLLPTLMVRLPAFFLPIWQPSKGFIWLGMTFKASSGSKTGETLFMYFRRSMRK